MKSLAVLLATLLAIPVPAVAGGICRNHCGHVVHQAAIVQKIVATPYAYAVAVPVVAPQSYYAVGERYVLRNEIAAALQDLQLQPQAAPQVQQQTWQPQQYQQPQVQRQTAGGCNCQAQQPAVAAAPDCSQCKCVPKTGQPANPQAPPDPEAQAPAGTELEQNVLRVFMSTENGKKACVACHGQTERLSGGLRLVNVLPDGALQLNTNLDASKREKVYRFSARGLMPPSVLANPQQPNNAHLVSDADLEFLSKWADG